jgi:Domain of unknown function (DUF4405)
MSTTTVTPPSTDLSVPRRKFSLTESLRNFWVDIALFVMFIVDMNTAFTGIAIHEWLGIALGVALVYHLLLHWQWIVNAIRRIFGGLPNAQRLRALVDLALFADMVVVVATGIWISRAALPAVGLSVAPNFFFSRLHHQSADLIVWLVGAHLALSWSWIATHVTRYIVRPLSRRPALQSGAANGQEGAQ